MPYNEWGDQDLKYEALKANVDEIYTYGRYFQLNGSLEVGEEYQFDKVTLYFNNNKRYINLNKLIGIDNNNDLSDLIIDLYKHKRLDGLFDKNDTAILDNNNNDVIEIILDREFIEYIKKRIN